MKLDTKKIIGIIIILVIILLVMLKIMFTSNEQTGSNGENVEIDTTSTDLSVDYGNEYSYNKETATKINLNNDAINVEGSGAKVSKNTVTINSAGTYYIIGTIEDGNIVVDSDKNAEVILVLANANITSKTTAPINGVKAKNTVIILEDGTQNNIEDGSKYIYSDSSQTEPDAAIFTKTDLVFTGKGTLNVKANYLDGIASKDTLKILNGNITVIANDDGIRGKDYVAIKNGTINITANSDGIKATNDTDTSLGYVAIEGGNITINSEEDGIQAETIVNIGDGTLNITSGGGSKNAISQNKEFQGFGRMENQEIIEKQNNMQAEEISSKGIKAGNEITIKNGKFILDTLDDSIHSNGIIIIDDGEFIINAGDDGIHADTNICINNGTININNSYEGVESSYIEINGGTVNITVSDDGINVAGGNDSSSIDGRIGQNNFNSVEESNLKLVINSGNINVSAVGDGLDSNGSIYMYGGNVVVSGPTSEGDGILDYNNEFIIEGGTLVGYGSSGMFQMPSSKSTQYVIAQSISGNTEDKISLKSSDGKEIVSATTNKSYSAVIISTPEIRSGSKYLVCVNNSEVSNVTVNSIITSNVKSMGGGMNKGNKMGR